MIVSFPIYAIKDHYIANTGLIANLFSLNHVCRRDNSYCFSSTNKRSHLMSFRTIRNVFSKNYFAIKNHRQTVGFCTENSLPKMFMKSF